MRLIRWTAFLLIGSLTGCVSLPLPTASSSRPRLAAELAAYYAYSPQPMEATTDSMEQGSGYRVERIRLNAPAAAGFRPIHLDWWRPSSGKPLPVVLLSPILAGDDLYIREFAQFYAARGLHAVIVYRPKEVFSADRQLQDIESHFHESVTQLRQVIDWLETQPGVDARRIGTFSISMGAILTTILAAVDPRVTCSVLGLPAGHLPEIIMSSKDKAIRKRRRAYLTKNGWNEAEGLRELKKVIRSEPMAFAPAIDPNRVMVIAGLFDRVLGFHRSLDLWRALGRPRLIVLPTGHYTAYFATPYLKLVSYSFLKRSLRSTSK